MAAVDTADLLLPEEFGYFLGYSLRPQTGQPLYSPYDQSLRVVGPMGCGKTFRFLGRVLRRFPGPLLATSSKPDVYELSAGARTKVGPVVTLDPQGVVPGQEPLRWSPVHGAHDTEVAELRARAFVAGTAGGGGTDEGASFYRDQASALLACLLHAAALDGASLRDVLRWARRLDDPAPRSILDHHPGAGPQWADMLVSVTSGDDRTVGNTRSTLSRALACFAHERVVDAIDVDERKATDIEALLDANGSLYLLGKDSPHSTVSPLVTAIAEDVLDRAERLAFTKPARRLDPPLLAALDEAANIAPLPSLRQRVADGRGRGLAVMYFLQAWASAEARFGKDNARELDGFTNNTLVFGGSGEQEFLETLEKRCGKVRVVRTSATSGRSPSQPGTQSMSEDWEPVFQSWQIAQMDKEAGEALLLAGNLPPVLTRLPLLSEDEDWPQIADEVAYIRQGADAARACAEAERRAEMERHRASWDDRRTGGRSVSMAKGDR